MLMTRSVIQVQTQAAPPLMPAASNKVFATYWMHIYNASHLHEEPGDMHSCVGAGHALTANCVLQQLTEEALASSSGAGSLRTATPNPHT
jgi:hypothetical protein